VDKEVKSIYPVVVSDGWHARVKAVRNSAGDLVITELQLLAVSPEAKVAGLTSSTLRQLKLTDLVESAVEDLEDVELQWLLDCPDDDSASIRNVWHNDVRGDWPRQGRTPHGLDMYAKTAFFYVDELRKNPTSPLQTLATKLDIDRITLARRIDKARQLGLLTRPLRVGNSPGKPGGSLTPKALAILEIGIGDQQ
jgi:hypothetical protein